MKEFLSSIWQKIKDSISGLAATWILRIFFISLTSGITWYKTETLAREEQEETRKGLEHIVQQVSQIAEIEINKNETLNKDNGCRQTY